MPTYETQPVVINETVKFELNAKKDGRVWDLTGATISLFLTSPSGTVTGPFSANQDSTSVASYTTATTDITAAGTWKRQWKIAQSGAILRSNKIGFYAVESAEASS